MDTNLPECASWKTWIGKECEGIHQGELTLFVRAGNVVEVINKLLAPVSRVWLCWEFLDSHSRDNLLFLVKNLKERKITIVIEVTPLSAATYMSLREYCIFFVKIGLTMLKPGDHVCVGAPFNDEAFCIGEGIKVTPADYAHDIRLD